MHLACALALLAGVTPLLAVAPVPKFSDPDRRAKLEKAFPEIERIFDKFKQERGIPGLIFGVVIDGDVAFVKAFGVQDRASQAPVTPDTVFRIASMTKSFTALAILKLRDEGKLSLEDPVAKWVPELAKLQYPTRDTAPLRVRQLITHAGGFPEDNPWGDRQLAVDEETFGEWLKKGLPFSTPPDTAYEYSNYGFAIAGRVVSRVSGRPYRAYVEEQILAPLGMKASTLEPAEVPRAVRATGYRKSGEEYVEDAPLPHGAFGAMGGLLTSARDLGRYVVYLLSAFPARDEEEQGPVRRSSLREMQQAWRTSAFGADWRTPDGVLQAVAGGYGYGLGVSRDCRFGHIVGHGGGLPGFGSYMLWLPEYGVGFFAMANLTYSGPRAAMDEALDVLRKTGALKPRALPPSPELESARKSIVRLWEQWSDQEANALAADNLFLDRPAAERRQEIERMKKDLGRCRDDGALLPENLLRGNFRMTCDHGFADIDFTLAPTVPPKVQHLRFSAVKQLEPAAKSLANKLASLIGSQPADGLSTLAASSLDADMLRRQMDGARAAYGACRLGETIGGDGAANVQVRFECDRGPLDVRIRMDAEGKLRAASFARAAGEACVP